MKKLAFVHGRKKVRFYPIRSQSHPKLHHNLFFLAPIKSNLKPSASVTMTDKSPKSLWPPTPTTEQGITGLLEHHACVHLHPRAETFSLPPLVGWAIPEGFWCCSTIAIEGWKLFPGHQEIPSPPPNCNERQWAALTLGLLLRPSPTPSCSSSAGAPADCPPPPLSAHQAGAHCSPQLSSSSSAVQALPAAPLWLLQTQVLWPRLPAAQQHLGGSCVRAAPLHTSVMAPLGAVWENDFNPTRQKQISYISSVHTDRAEVKCLLFFCWTANAVDTDLPFKWERLYYQPLAAVPSWGQVPAPCLSPKH